MRCGTMLLAQQCSILCLKASELSGRQAYAAPHRHFRKPKLKIAVKIGAYKIKASANDDQPDVVTRVFGRLFGNRLLDEKSPGGMKRMSEEAMLEQYPATLTETAAPVEGDDDAVAVIRPLLAQTRLQKLPLRCAQPSCDRLGRTLR